jgi:hypothetical protein
MEDEMKAGRVIALQYPTNFYSTMYQIKKAPEKAGLSLAAITIPAIYH